MVWNLEEHALDLLDLVDLDVPHGEDTDEGQACDGGTRDQHVPLGLGVGSYDGCPGLSADLVAELNVKRVVDILPQLGSLGWEQSLESIGQGVGPDGAGDRVTDSSTKVPGFWSEAVYAQEWHTHPKRPRVARDAAASL